MILTSPTPDGYIFNFRGEVIGIGTYTEEDFFLLETDNTTSTHSNGMAALGYMRMKYTPEYYKVPVKSYNNIQPRISETKHDLTKFKQHQALVGVFPLAKE